MLPIKIRAKKIRAKNRANPLTLRPVLKYPVTILLILLIGLQTFSKWALILQYRVNKEYIAKNLCVKRNTVSCGVCLGKCFLHKKLAGDESQQQAPGRSGQKEESPLPLFSQRTQLPELSCLPAGCTHSTRWLPANSREFIHSIFQPPQA
jgi:hypothetical protein